MGVKTSNLYTSDKKKKRKKEKKRKTNKNNCDANSI